MGRPVTRHYPAPKPRVNKKPVEPMIHPDNLSLEMKTHWQGLIALGALELQENVSLSLVKRAFRRLAKELHPDLSQHYKGPESLLRLQNHARALEKGLRSSSSS